MEERTADRRENTQRANPTSPLGVGGLARFLFHPSLFPFGEGFTPPPYPLPWTWTGGAASGQSAQDGSKMAPRWPQRAQDDLQGGSR